MATGMDRELTPEGAEMFNNIGNDAYFEALEKKSKKKPNIKEVYSKQVDKLEAEMTLLKLEIQVLKQNSELVLSDCKDKIVDLTEKEDYRRASMYKVVGFLHKSFANRLDRVLNGLPCIDRTETVNILDAIQNIEL